MPLTRTSLQSFRFLPQNPCIHRPVRAVEITRTSLQSLVPDLFDGFYYVPFATHDCAVHNPNDFLGILFDTREPERYPANAYFGLVAMNDSLSFSLLLSYWLNFVEHFDMLWKNNNSGSLCVDYTGMCVHNVDKQRLRSLL